jgi:PPM family protein phosphatase
MVMKLMPYKVTSYGTSDIGLVRQNNEDSWAQLPDLNFFALADGMGGHRAGEVAAKEAVKALCEQFEQTLAIAGPQLSLDEAHGLVQLAIEHANHHVYELSLSDAEYRGMGTTLCCVYCHPKGIIFAHVGDSRIYRLHNQSLDLLTKDHSLLMELVDMGQIDEQSSSEFLYKNIITKAVGTESSVEPTIHICEVADQDIFLLCSDGLSDMLSTKEMEKILNETKEIETAGKALVAKANKKGGFDNTTIVLVKIKV